MLVSALFAAGGARAQIFLNLETNEFSTERKSKAQNSKEDSIYDRAPVLSHEHDVEDWRQLEEQAARQSHKTMQEVHHPREDMDFGSVQDWHRHMFP